MNSCDIPGIGLKVAPNEVPDPAADVPAAEDRGEAVLAGGCFWCTEAVFRRLEGVEEVVPGYAGGAADAANYKAVCSGRSGHAEVIRISYDPKRISYGQLLKVFFAVAHDPTQKDRQGNDVGTQYRSAVFPMDAAQGPVAEAGRGQRRLVAVTRRLDRGALLVRAVVDGRAVLRPDVVALAHALRRVMALPERPQDVVERDLRGVEHDEHGLGVAGRAAADLLVRRVRRVAARVAGCGRVDAVELPEQALGAPKAAEPDDELLHLLGERRRERGAEDVVALGHGNRSVPPRERPVRVDHLGLLTEQEHGSRVDPEPYRGVTADATQPLHWASRRGGRVAEGTRLLSEYGEEISIAGSNPALSAGGG